LPLAHAGVGSAVNDTTRQVGGALGVAVLGSLLSAAYRSTMDGAGAVRALPGPVAAAARDSVARAGAVAQRLGGQPGQAVLAAARQAFIDAMDRTVLVAAAVAVLGALVALLFLPARAEAGTDEGRARPVEAEPVET